MQSRRCGKFFLCGVSQGSVVFLQEEEQARREEEEQLKRLEEMEKERLEQVTQRLLFLVSSHRSNSFLPLTPSDRSA